MKTSPSKAASCCDDAPDLSAGLAALSHPARIRILQSLADGGACCCKDVVGNFDLAQSTVSQHLKVLVDAGLLHQRAQAQKTIYEIDTEAVSQLAASVARLAERCCVMPEQGPTTGKDD